MAELTRTAIAAKKLFDPDEPSHFLGWAAGKEIHYLQSSRSASTSLVKRSIACAWRKNEADKRFLIERIKRLAIHSQLGSARDSLANFPSPNPSQFQLRPK
jgi:hypothetical protein